MKTVAILFLLALFSTAFTLPIENACTLNSTAAEEFAKKTMLAFQQNSSDHFESLFPTLSDFMKLFDSNACAFGNTIEDARIDFANSYEKHLLPAVREAFNHIQQEGTKKGIDWRTIEFVRAETKKSNLQKYDLVPLTILFTSKGNEYKLRFERALILDDQWKASQFVTLN